ncbi:hypothetical protein X734_32940 [Mesorhizobium sp. L2C084A000]|nr:hypothetical protein X734_32940 [Mesorhizobium sp. L2C084A000]
MLLVAGRGLVGHQEGDGGVGNFGGPGDRGGAGQQRQRKGCHAGGLASRLQ